MKITDLKPGLTVYDVHSYRMGGTSLRSVGVWEVRIVSVNAERETCVASWNGNPTTTHYRHEWARWRLKRPAVVSTGMCGQQRLETRAEKALRKSAGSGSHD